jgi:alkylation response protein AidB-like acyl-CoA dehydrogenase
MDFELSPDQRELTDLAERIFTERATTARVAEIEADPDRIDRELWTLLADAGLLGLSLPPEFGGSGAGLLELCLVLEQQGRRVAPVPLWPTLLLGAFPIAMLGNDAQQERWLPPVAAGTCILTGAANGVDVAGHSGPVAGRIEGEHLHLTGEALSVPVAHLAERILVPVYVPPSGWYLVLLDPDTAGVRRTSAATTDRQIHQHLRLDEVVVPLAEAMVATDDALAHLLDLARIGLCALQVGVVEQAIAITATHISQRRQFGRELATFQAVAMRAADAYIDIAAMRLTMLHAAWRLDQDQPAAAETAVAKWWSADAGHRVIHSALHLHGGIGNDVEYPLHRHFLWSRQLGLTLGGAAQQLASLGAQVGQLSLTEGAHHHTF